VQLTEENLVKCVRGFIALAEQITSDTLAANANVYNDFLALLARQITSVTKE
jgi:hypothetical protein